MGIERRRYVRFALQGSRIEYYTHGIFGWFRSETIQNCPVFDLSRGGLSFLTNEAPKNGRRIVLSMSYSGWDSARILKGVVRQVGRSPVLKYKYRIGIQFGPFGLKPGENAPDTLMLIEEAEKIFGGEQFVFVFPD